eukprot:NODE_1612_length_1101_cov_674.900574.p1 GENE.NODE_1612_length_1101_cov_674.900574~~NODE_1612_length_1101_cov_674.900574.p1  ORF type:complete len:296 (+),score=53.16 NODE_1612_length_1101_cov_674.900574:3-890(+)
MGEHAECAVRADEQRIRQRIEDHGGYEPINRRVAKFRQDALDEHVVRPIVTAVAGSLLLVSNLAPLIDIIDYESASVYMALASVAGTIIASICGWVIWQTTEATNSGPRVLAVLSVTKSIAFSTDAAGLLDHAPREALGFLIFTLLAFVCLRAHVGRTACAALALGVVYVASNCLDFWGGPAQSHWTLWVIAGVVTNVVLVTLCCRLGAPLAAMAWTLDAIAYTKAVVMVYELPLLSRPRAIVALSVAAALLVCLTQHSMLRSLRARLTTLTMVVLFVGLQLWSLEQGAFWYMIT